MSDFDLTGLTEQASNWATVIATIISVVSLWLAVWVNHDAKRPQVIASLEFDGDKNIVYLVVQNLGEGVAYDIRFSGYNDAIFMDQYRTQVMKSFVTKGIPVLVPKSKRSTIVAAGRIMDAMQDSRSDVVVTYFERGLMRKLKKVTETFVLDYSSFSGALYTDSEMKLIRRSLQKLEEDVKGIRSDVSKAK